MNKDTTVDFSYNPIFFKHDPTHAVLNKIPRSELKLLGEHFASVDPWARLGVEPKTLSEYFSQSEDRAPRYAIFIANNIAGIVGLRLNWLKGPYLQFLGILPNYQGRGLGSAVLSWMTEEARRHLDQNIWVCASAFNTQALHFYETFGFSRVALLEGLVTSKEDETLFRLRL